MHGDLQIDAGVPMGAAAVESGNSQLAAGFTQGGQANLDVVIDVSGLKIVAIPMMGLPKIVSTNVEVDSSGVHSFHTIVNIPTPATENAPVITEASLEFVDAPSGGGKVPAVKLVGDHFGDDPSTVQVLFRTPISDIIKATPMSGDAHTLHVPIPQSVTVGIDQISVNVQQAQPHFNPATNTSVPGTTLVESNRISLTPSSSYVVGALPGSNKINVIDTDTRKPLAYIPVGDGQPRDVSLTPDATRAYVTMRYSARVAVVDMLALQQADAIPHFDDTLNPRTPKQYVEIPGATPFWIKVDPLGKCAYVSDERLGKIYVIDTNPESEHFNECVDSIDVSPAPQGLCGLDISADGKRLYVAAPQGNLFSTITQPPGQILVVDIDPADKPTGTAMSSSKWHKQIAAIVVGLEPYGVTATADAHRITFTDRGNDLKGLGMIQVTNDSATGFKTQQSYVPLSLGSRDDYFDVNNGQAVAIMPDLSYAFVSGYDKYVPTVPAADPNSGDIPGGGNVGIVKDPFGINGPPALVAATRPTPFSFPDNLVLSEGRYLYAAYRGVLVTDENGNPTQGAVFVFDTKEMIRTLGIFSSSLLSKTPIDDLSSAIDINADYRLTSFNASSGDYTFGVPPGSMHAPIATGGSVQGLTGYDDSLRLISPVATGVEPQANITFTWDDGGPGFKNKFFLSVYRGGDGLFPVDTPTSLGADHLINGDIDFTRIANGIDRGENQSYTLPSNLRLTAGNTYFWGVEATAPDGSVHRKWTSFKTNALFNAYNFPSVTLLTHGFQIAALDQSIPQDYQVLARAIANAGGGGAVAIYDPDTGYWDGDAPQYGKPLVLLSNWVQDSKISDSGFAEAAADAIFAALVSLDKRNQGAIFSSPMHLIGFDRGTVVTSEIVQRLGKYVPNIPDLQMTTLDPHDLPQNSLNLPVGQLLVSQVASSAAGAAAAVFGPVASFIAGQLASIAAGSLFHTILGNLGTIPYGDFREPRIMPWDNTTFYDNYWQAVADGNRPFSILHATLTANGRPVPGADIDLALVGRAGFTQDDSPVGAGSAHQRVKRWYAGTVNVDIPSWDGEPIYRRLEQRDAVAAFHNSASPWYTAFESAAGSSTTHGDTSASWEGIGEGWFYSVLGGGRSLRPHNPGGKVTVDTDNTNYGGDDLAVPSIYNGSFDDSIRPLARFPVGAQMPGWSFHGGSGGLLQGFNLVHPVPGSNSYAAAFGSGGPNGLIQLTHNRMLVPSWANYLRLDLQVVTPSPDDHLHVRLTRASSGQDFDLVSLPLTIATDSLKTLSFPVPAALQGDVATLTLEGDDTALDGHQALFVIDNVFFSQVAVGSANHFAVLTPVIDEGGTAQVQGIIDTTANPNGTMVTITWGDNSQPDMINVPMGQNSFTASHVYQDNAASAQPPDTYTVRAEYNGASFPGNTGSIVVHNVAPSSIVPTVPQSVMEGEQFTLSATFVDPGVLDTHTVDIDWGDGDPPTTISLAANVLTVSAQHTYADNGSTNSYTISITVHDDDGGDGSQDVDIAVANVAPTLADVQDETVTEGDALDLSSAFSFTDPGFADDEAWHYTIAWGDGNMSEDDVTNFNTGSEGTPSSGMFGDKHTYGQEGSYTVTVTVKDKDGGTDTKTFSVTVDNADLTITPPGTPDPIDEGSTLDLTDMFTFSDPGFGDNLAWKYSIDWGDDTDPDTGTVSNVTAGSADMATEGTFGGMHQYKNNKPMDEPYEVKVTVTDPQQHESDPVTLMVTVKNVAPEITVPRLSVATAGLLFHPQPGWATFTDPGAEPENSIGAQFDYGDGSPFMPDDNVDFTSDDGEAPTEGKISADNTYDKEGIYYLTVYVSDEDGAVTSHTVVVNVNGPTTTTGTSVGQALFGLTAPAAAMGSQFVAGANDILMIDSSGSVQSHFPIPGNVAGFGASLAMLPAGISFGGTMLTMPALMVFNPSVRQAFAVDPANGHVLASLLALPGSDVVGATYDNVKNEIFLVDRGAHAVLGVDPDDGSVKDRFTPATAAVDAGAIAIDPRNGDILLVTSIKHRIDVLDASGANIGSFDETGLGFDNDTFTSAAFSGSTLFLTTQAGAVKSLRLPEFREDVFLQAAGAPASDQPGRLPSAAELSSLAAVAREEWAAAGISASQLARLDRVQLRVADLGANLVGETRATGNNYVVTIDDNAGGFGWFTDPTPAIPDEFAHQVSTYAFQALAGSPAADHMDLLTVIAHEFGHVLGFGHTDPTSHPNDLMNNNLGAGQRRLPAAHAAYPALRSGSSAALFGLPSNIVNGDFGVADPADPQFGWTTHGSASVVAGQAVLDENSQAESAFLQSFVIPANTQALRFTITGLNLAANGPNTPPDAFEAALLDASTMKSLVGTPAGLSNTDDFLNIQQNGTVFKGAQVTVQSLAAGALLVSVDLSAVPAGTNARLIFDLLAFGPAASSVSLDNVALIGSGSSDHAPVAKPDSYTMTQGGTLVPAPDTGVLANDSDVDNDPLTAVLVGMPAHGTLNLQADGSFVYTPAADFSGTDTFTYKANDGLVDGNTVTVTITVNAVVIPPTNHPPVANADSYTMNQGATLVPAPDTGVLANDSDPDNDPLTAVLVGMPAHGTLNLHSDGSFVYTPAADFSGTDTFTYKANDGLVDGNTVTVTITVNPVVPPSNHPPVANADSYTMNEGATLVPTRETGVLANDSDADKDPLTAVLVGMQAHGTLNLHSDGSFVYTPAASFSGTDTFTYKANDGQADSNTVTVTITVNPVIIPPTNHPPVANADSYTMNQGATLSPSRETGVLANDSDADNDPLTAVLVGMPAHGTLSLHSDGSFVYTPAADFSGTDTFAYKANDGQADSNIATVTITVNAVVLPPVNHPPTADAGPDQAVAERSAVTLHGTLTDPDAGDTHTLVWSVTASNGQTVPGGSGDAFTFTPANDGTYTVTLTVTDNHGSSANSSAVITATDVPPVVTIDGPASVMPGVAYTLNLSAVDLGADTIDHWTVNWGDGTIDTLAGNPQSAIHTYGLICANYTVSARATDQEGAYAAAGTVQVRADFGVPSRCYIAQVYEDLFHRQADLSGLVFWSTLVGQGMSRTGVVTLMERDAGHEFYRNEIADFYQAYLGRSADEAGMKYWVGYLAAGATLEQTRAAFLTSPEYFKTEGAQSDDAFLSAAYQSALHRKIDAGGRDFYTQALHDGATREQVADALFGSGEFRLQTAYDLYARLLRRLPDPAGLDFWAFGLDHSIAEQVKLTDFLASDEYFARATR
jgi:VCBS repeat-containing protein